MALCPPWFTSYLRASCSSLLSPMNQSNSFSEVPLLLIPVSYSSWLHTMPCSPALFLSFRKGQHPQACSPPLALRLPELVFNWSGLTCAGGSGNRDYCKEPLFITPCPESLPPSKVHKQVQESASGSHSLALRCMLSSLKSMAKIPNLCTK